MYGIDCYQEDDQWATPSDAVNEFARNAGAENQDREWLLTSYDSWVKNPYYTGAPGRHPEGDYYDDEDEGDLSSGALIACAINVDEDIPF
jgi:hypothetical protein